MEIPLRILRATITAQLQNCPHQLIKNFRFDVLHGTSPHCDGGPMEFCTKTRPKSREVSVRLKSGRVFPTQSVNGGKTWNTQ